MKILIVDDNADARMILGATLKSDGYAVVTAGDGAEALRLARESPPDMIISDILMPVMDGFQLCRRCRDDERLVRQLEKKVEDLEASNLALRRSEAELKDLFESFVRTMVGTLDAKSRWTMGHSERVAGYAEELAREAGLDDREIADLRLAALLHDIGKIGLRDSVLDKISGLTDEEYEEVKKHAALGAEILDDIKQLRHLTPAIRHHHERLDGSGYPDGIQGREIGRYADIIHIADAFDSMTADRPYRHAQGEGYAVSKLKRLAGSHFDPGLVKAFLRVLERRIVTSSESSTRKMHSNDAGR